MVVPLDCASGHDIMIYITLPIIHPTQKSFNWNPCCQDPTFPHTGIKEQANITKRKQLKNEESAAFYRATGFVSSKCHSNYLRKLTGQT